MKTNYRKLLLPVLILLVNILVCFKTREITSAVKDLDRKDTWTGIKSTNNSKNMDIKMMQVFMEI